MPSKLAMISHDIVPSNSAMSSHDGHAGRRQTLVIASSQALFLQSPTTMGGGRPYTRHHAGHTPKTTPWVSTTSFSLVSKEWRKLISSPQIFRLQNKNHRKLIVYNKSYLSHLWSIDCKACYRDERVTRLKLPNIGSKECNLDAILCSCDGPLCLTVGADLFLWNPVTREYWKLPSPHKSSLVLSYGLGYDSSVDDYK